MTNSETIHELSECIINLPAIVDVVSAHALYEDLTHASHAFKLIIHAEKVERITTPGIQLLLAAEKSLAPNGGTLTVVTPSDVFKQTMIDLGLNSQLKKWSSA
jgi:anti-anti-sigma regulatory factor